MAKVKGLYSQSEEDEHDKQIVYDIPCIKHDGYYFCILHSIVLKQFRKSVGMCQTFLTSTAGTW